MLTKEQTEEIVHALDGFPPEKMPEVLMKDFDSCSDKWQRYGQTLEYIQDHEEEVRAVHAKVESRIECGNSLEVEGKRQASATIAALLKASHEKPW